MTPPFWPESSRERTARTWRAVLFLVVLLVLLLLVRRALGASPFDVVLAGFTRRAL